MELELRYIDKIIQRKRWSIRSRMIFASLIILFGVTLTLISLYLKEGLYLTIGSSLILTITAWPIKEINDYRDSIEFFKSFKEDLRSKQNNTQNCENTERIKFFVWQAVEKLAVK